MTVAVEVPKRNGPGPGSCRERASGGLGECSRAVAKEDGYSLGVIAGDDEIQLPVTIKVGCSHGVRIGASVIGTAQIEEICLREDNCRCRKETNKN